VCSSCECDFGPADGVLALFTRAPEPRISSEADAVRRLTSDPARRAYLLDLARRFETTNVAESIPEYAFYRGLRWLLNQTRMLLTRMEQ
jgi:hypothetical protein